ncbi:MAG: hypothetical protein ACPHGY_02085, partial [Rhodospirillaceae bacterium]
MEAKKVIAELETILGSEHVLVDQDTLDQFAEDLFFSGCPPITVIAPASVEDISKSVRTCTAAGIAVLP